MENGVEMTILEKKYQAIEEFTRRLLASEVEDSIAKIILFGSVRKGEARADSDIDLLVLAANSIDRVTEVCLDVSFETNVALGESIEPLVYCLDTLRFPDSYFVYYNIKTGEEIYSMDEERLRRAESLGYLELAEEYRRSAQNCSNCGDWRLAVDGAYNAAELCAKGLLLLKLEDLPTSHGGLFGKFGELYIKPGILPREMGRALNKGLWLRAQARYERHAQIGQDEAKSMLDLATKLIAALSNELGI
nr:HEPN domain-containing protein [Anaerolineae bacterium]